MKQRKSSAFLLQWQAQRNHKPWVFLVLILSIHILAYGDVESQFKYLFNKSAKESVAQNYAKALEYLIEAKTIAENNNSIKMQIYVLNNMGAIYIEILDYEEAMECFTKAYQMVIKEPHKYKKEETYILINISIIYSNSGDFDNAKEYACKAYNAAFQLQDSAAIVMSAINLAVYFNQTGDWEQAEKYLNSATKMFTNQNALWLLKIKFQKVNILYLRKEYNKAEQLSLDILNQDVVGSDKSFKIDVLLKLSQTYQQKMQFQKAIETAKDALNISSNSKNLAEIYEQLSKVYVDMGDFYWAHQYLDSMIMAKDSLNTIINRNNLQINQMKFDLINSEQALADNKAKQKAEQLFFIFIIAFVVFVGILSIIILVLVFRTKSAKNRQKTIRVELELEKQTNEKLVLEQEKLLIERQLTSKILFQSDKNDLIKEVISLLSETSNTGEDIALRLKKAVKKLKKMQGKESAEWNSFLTYFEHINPDFLSALKKKHPDLNVSEMRVLSYMYLDLETKEIAKLLNIAPNSCSKKKQRIADKMNIPTQNMYNYLKTIELE